MKNIIARVKKPTEAEAKALASYFPSSSMSRSSSSRKHSVDLFDPSGECVALPQQKKKKAASKGNPKPTVVTVVLMEKFSMRVPKGKVRQKLYSEGRIQSVSLRRTMSFLQVKNAIIRAFTRFQLSHFTILECDQGCHNLSRACVQEIDGEKVLQRRGCLYLCEEFEVG